MLILDACGVGYYNFTPASGGNNASCLECPVDTYKSDATLVNCTECPVNSTTLTATAVKSVTGCRKLLYFILLTAQPLQHSSEICYWMS